MQLEEKIMNLYENETSKNSVQKKVISILKSVIVDKEDNLGVIIYKAHTSPNMFNKLVNDKDLFLKYITKKEYNDFLKLLLPIINKEKTDKYNLAKNIITDILESRLKLEDIATKNYVCLNVLNKIITDEKYITQNFGKDVFDKINTRIIEVRNLKKYGPRDKCFIEEAHDLKIVKSEFDYLDDYNFKRLRVVSTYIMYEADIEYVSELLEMPISTIYSYINDIKIKDLIKEEYYNLLQEYIKYEKILISANIKEKRELISLVITNLKNNVNNLYIPKGIIKRVIEDNLFNLICSSSNLELIKEKLDFKDEVKKSKNK